MAIEFEMEGARKERGKGRGERVTDVKGSWMFLVGTTRLGSCT